MAKNQDKDKKEGAVATVEPEERPDPQPDLRVDEYARDMFYDTLGFPMGPLPDLLVEVYNDLKTTKDRMHAGLLSPEGFATVMTIYRLKSWISGNGNG